MHHDHGERIGMVSLWMMMYSTYYIAASVRFRCKSLHPRNHRNATLSTVSASEPLNLRYSYSKASSTPTCLRASCSQPPSSPPY